MRESVVDKAKKLLRDGRAKITHTTYTRIKAIVLGDHGEYRVEVLRNGNFNCECNNYIYTDSTVECSHILSIKIHPQYKEWWPCKELDGEVIVDEGIYKQIPEFSLDTFEVEKQRSVVVKLTEEEFNQAEAGRHFDEITQFVRKKRFVEGCTYDEIIDAVKEEFDLEISRGYVYVKIQNEPDTGKCSIS